MDQSILLAQAVTERTIRDLAGDRYYERGLDYFRRGRVVSIEVWENAIHAMVSGTENYSVEIAAGPGGLDFSCDCPLGEDGEFCKHCVAAALAWLNRQHGTPRAEPGKRAPRTATPKTRTLEITTKDIARVLESTDKAALVELVLEWARDEAGLRTKLLHYTALAMGPEAAVHQAKNALEKAVRIRRFVPCQEAGGYAGTVDSAIDAVENLLLGGHASAAIDLCEAGLRWLAAATESIDDSDGQMTELMERLQDIHLRACEAAKPDPVALAGRLFRGELLAKYDEFHGSAERYAKILGREGLQAFRKLAETEWAKVPVRTSEGRSERESNDSSITSIMTSLARQSGDVEQLVAVLERDLDGAYQYLRIAEAYREANKADKALEWAEKGMAAFPDRTDSRLRLFIAEEYRRRGRHQDALRIIWLDFQDHTGLDTYKLLERFAREDDDWEEWRERALRQIRRNLSAKPAQTRPGVMLHSWADRRRDHSLLVEIFLYERKPEEAWPEARAGGCSDTLWLRLARTREKTKPEEAVPIYLRLAEANVVNAHSHRYDDPVKLLEQAARLQQGLGRSLEFHQHLDALRQKYKAKRNFQKLIEERKQALYLE